jgi:hypothetical protein
MLATVIRRHWPALHRDVLALGYRASDMFTTLTWADMVSIVVGANPHNSVRFFLDNGWTREAHLLANLHEHNAGVAKLSDPYPREGVEDRTPAPNQSSGFFAADSHTWDEFDELERIKYSEQHQAKAAEARGAGTTRVRTL